MPLSTTITAEAIYPILSNDPYADYNTAWDTNTIRIYLVRSTGGGVESIPLPLPDDDFTFETMMIDEVRQKGDKWEATIYEAEISRKSVSMEDVRDIQNEEYSDNEEEDDVPSSANYKARRYEGWVSGGAKSKYANTEPHHGKNYNYEEMYNPHREATLTAILEGNWNGRTEK